MTRRIQIFGQLALRVAVLALLVFCVCVAAIPMTQANPADDLNLSLAREGTTNVYDLTSEGSVAAIFRDRLDLFPRSQAPKLARHLLGLCAAYRFDPAFILSLIQVESRFRLRALSPVGAVGLMQIMPATARRVVEVMQLELPIQGMKLRAAQLADPFVNLTIGVAYLAWLRNHYRGLSPYYLVAAYNIGPTRMDALRAQPGGFRPVLTKRYFEAVRRGIPEFRARSAS